MPINADGAGSTVKTTAGRDFGHDTDLKHNTHSHNSRNQQGFERGTPGSVLPGVFD